MSKQQIINEIHRSARKNYNRRRVILKGIGDLWQADLIDLQRHAKFNKGYKYILVVIDAFSKFAWCAALKNKTKTEIKNAFVKLLKTENTPKHLQTDHGKEFYNSEFQSIMNAFNINHYSTYSSKKASIVERLIRTLKSKLYKHFSLVGNYIWIGQPLEDVVNTYNNTVHRIIKYKPKDVNCSNESIVKRNLQSIIKPFKKPKSMLNVGDYVRISKYKAEFQKGYTPNWSTEIFRIKKVYETNPVTYIIEDQRKQAILGSFYKEELQKTKVPDLYLVEKVLRRKGNQLFVKWLGLSSKDNSWIDKKNVILR